MDYGQFVSGGFGLIGSALNYGFQKKLMEQQNQYNIDMWKMQNEYNSPAAQMKRFEEAGLNPGLMYGQVTPGNASSAPQMGTPEAPQISRDMRELAKAFNIEGLKQAIAETKIKQSEARAAEVNAQNAEDEQEAREMTGFNYRFNPNTGGFEVDPVHLSYQRANGKSPAAYYYQMRFLADNYRTNALLVPRAQLIGSQRYLNSQRTRLLAPQIGIADYQYQYRKPAFWIGQGGQVLNTISKFIP